MNDRVISIGIWAIVAFVVLGLVVAFGLPLRSTAPAGVVAEVNGEAISRETFDAFRRGNEQLADSLDTMDENVVRGLIDRQTLDQLISRTVEAQEAEALGLRVTDDELREYVRSEPSFQSNGKFDAERFRAFALTSDFGKQLTAEMRRDLLIAKFNRLLISPVRVSESAARDALRRERTRFRLRYAAALEDDFLGQVVIPDAELLAFADSAPDRIQELYDRRRGEFQRPEEVRVRQVLFEGEDARGRAEQARQALQGGADFGDLARERSQDEATRALGGDLGFLPRGRLQPQLDAAAFALQPGELSEPIETPQGIHLLRVEERRPSVHRPLEDVRLELALELRRAEAARRAARETADKLAARLAAGEDFFKASEALGLRVEETPPFGISERIIPELGALPGLRETAAQLTEAKPTSTHVLEGPRGFYLVSLLERKEPDAQALESELTAMREQLESRARSDVRALWIMSRVRELEAEQKLVRHPLDS